MRTVCGAIAAAVLLFTHPAAASEDFVEAVEKITPSVATIVSTATPEGSGQLCSVTTGVVVSPDGLILTACHAVVGFDTIAVRLPDGKTHPATMHGSDALSGLALLKIDAVDLTPAEFADSDELRVGQWVLSVGNQFGVEQSSSPGFSVGIIGRLKCVVPYANLHHRELIKTDAAMNPGCVGGPLVDRRGRVVGINIAICSSTGVWQGVGYAIPSNVVVHVLEKLKAGEKIERGWLGVRILDDAQVRIGAVGEGTPAEKAGLQKGDVVVAYNGKNIADTNELVDIVASTRPGAAVVVTITRDGNEQDVTVQVGVRPANLSYRPFGSTHGSSSGPGSKAIDSVLPPGMTEKLAQAENGIQEAMRQFFDEIKDPELVAKYKQALEKLPGIELRLVSPQELDQLREENRDLKNRVEQLEELLKNR